MAVIVWLQQDIDPFWKFLQSTEIQPLSVRIKARQKTTHMIKNREIRAADGFKNDRIFLIIFISPDSSMKTV